MIRFYPPSAGGSWTRDDKGSPFFFSVELGLQIN